MLERLIEQANRFHCWYSTQRTHLGLRLLRGMSTLGILTVSAWFIWKQMYTGYTTISAADIHLDPRRLVVSWLCTVTCTALGAWEWVMLVNALGGHLDIIRGMRIHLTSNLFKYVPGFIWPYVGKTYVATRQGIPASAIVLSVVCEFVIVFFDGGLLMMLSLPFSGIISWSTGQCLVFQVIAILLTGVSIASVPLAGRWLVGVLEHANVVQGVTKNANWNQVTFVIVAILLTWCLLGFGFSALGAQASSDNWQGILRQAFALASALLMGQMVFFAPMGIGIREAVLVALLGSGSSAARVVVIALVFRLEMMIGEIVCTLIALLLDKRSWARRA